MIRKASSLIVISLKSNIVIILMAFFILCSGVLMGLNIPTSESYMDTYIRADSALHLIVNNIVACLFLASGILTLGGTTLFYGLFNGLIIGVAIRDAFQNNMDISEILVKLIPHGIFELPALILASAIGLKAVDLIIRMYFSKKRVRIVLYQGFLEILTLIILVLILICLAGLIEWYITPS
ncbi:stage II sporulation protein M [Bacillus sp. S70]|nr:MULTISPECIES: stage II sporulation protein M [Bacillus]MED2789932.1 stage II sporulation protein M [Bacillus thuringiensis]MBJ9979741.1 stage II sporulation protein M [Bacillus sp. S29]MBK0100919.1 stage II sporulation protein M [Bacillus sp. S70]MBK0105537.1 stage II sporulation protein M [Bacillus sp. S73]MBK0134368.1 stage II sporulation protein M [Bacillus sp. S72]